MRKNKHLGSYRIYLLYVDTVSENILEKGFYIGYTKLSVENRIKAHLTEAKHSKKFTKKLNWLRSIDSSLIKFIILHDNIKAETEALQKEVECIAFYKNSVGCEFLKNGDDGGIGGTKNYTPEVIEKIRQSKVGNKWNIGRQKTEETKNRIKESNKNKIVTEETKEKIRKSAINKNNSLRVQGLKVSNNKRKFSKDQLLEMFRLYNQELKSSTEIGKIVNCSKETVSTAIHHKEAYKDWKKEYSLSAIPRPKGYMSMVRKRIKEAVLTPEQEKELDNVTKKD
jgi:hypothetical protein